MLHVRIENPTIRIHGAGRGQRIVRSNNTSISKHE
jgi:hypothetical protein